MRGDMTMPTLAWVLPLLVGALVAWRWFWLRFVNPLIVRWIERREIAAYMRLGMTIGQAKDAQQRRRSAP